MSNFNSAFGLPILVLQIGFGSVLATAVQTGLLDGRLPFFMAAAIYVAAISWWFVYTLLARTTQFSLIHVFALMTAAFFASKAFNAWDDFVDWAAPLSDYIWTLVISQAGLLALLVGARSVERYVGGSPLVDWLWRLAEDVNRGRFGLVFPVLIVVQVIAHLVLYQSGLFLQQFGTPDVERPYWITSLNMIYPSLRVICLAIAVMQALRGARRQRKLGYVVMTVELLIAFVSGRSAFFESALLCFVIVTLLNYRRSSMRRYAIVGVGLLVFSAGIAWPAYQHVRVVASPYFAENPFEDKFNAMFERVIPEALASFDWATVYEPTSDYRANLVARLSGGDFPAAILDSQNRGKSYMYGDVVKTSLALWIPRYFWPEKPNVNEEEVVIDHYDLADNDQTSSLLGFALADFGIIGVLSYLFAFGALLRLFEAYATTTRTALFALMTFALCFPLAMNIEGDITHIGAILRIWLILVIVELTAFRGKSGQPITRKSTSATP